MWWFLSSVADIQVLASVCRRIISQSLSHGTVAITLPQGHLCSTLPPEPLYSLSSSSYISAYQGMIVVVVQPAPTAAGLRRQCGILGDGLAWLGDKVGDGHDSLLGGDA